MRKEDFRDEYVMSIFTPDMDSDWVFLEIKCAWMWNSCGIHPVPSGLSLRASQSLLALNLYPRWVGK